MFEITSAKTCRRSVASPTHNTPKREPATTTMMMDDTRISPTAAGRLHFCVPIDVIYCRLCVPLLYHVWRVLCAVLGCHLRAGRGATWKSPGKENGRSKDYQRCVRFVLPFFVPASILPLKVDIVRQTITLFFLSVLDSVL